MDAREVTVTEDDGFGVIDAKRLEQGVQSGFLRCSAGVLGTALGVETALVADADAVLVVVEGMGAGEVLVTGLIYLAVAGDVVVVAGEAEAAVVVGDEPRDGVRLVLAGRRAVNNDEFYFAHNFLNFEHRGSSTSEVWRCNQRDRVLLARIPQITRIFFFTITSKNS